MSESKSVTSEKLLSQLGEWWQKEVKKGNVAIKPYSGTIRFGFRIRSGELHPLSAPHPVVGIIISTRENPRPTEYIYGLKGKLGVTAYDGIWVCFPEKDQLVRSYGFLKDRLWEERFKRRRENGIV